MPRPIWTGAVSFGLVTIPIRISGASENRGVSFHRIHLEDGGRVRNQKRCEIDDEVVTDDDIGKGYELTKDQIVPVTDEELDAIPLPTAKTVEILAFMDRDAIDPVRLGQSFYLEASGQAAVKPYVLLRRALERSGRVAVTKLALRGRERLAVLDIRDDALTLHTMHWPDEVRSPAELAPGPVDLSADEIAQAMSLIDGMTTDDLSAFHDEYRYAVEELLAAKAEGRQPPKVSEGPQPGRVVDLMAALEQSVARAKESRGEEAGGEGGGATVHEMPRKRAGGRAGSGSAPASRSAPASKAAARKTPAAKASAAGRTAGEKASAGKTAPEKAPAKKPAAGRTSAPRPPAKTAAKKTAAKKTAAGGTSAKSAAEKAAAGKTPSTKRTAAAKKTSAKKTTDKGTSAKKVAKKASAQPRRKAS